MLENRGNRQVMGGQRTGLKSSETKKRTSDIPAYLTLN